NNDNFYWNIWQGLIEYAKKLDIYDEQLDRRLAIKPILYESPISTMGFDRGYKTNQNYHIGELDNMAQNIKVESKSNDLTQVNRSLINEYQIDNSHTSSRDTNTQEDVEMTNVEDYHNIHGYSNPNEINVKTAYQDIIVSEDIKTLIELKDTWAKNNHEKF
ncbi:1097_t:CDS:1, partial [Racocetra fulgida]